MIRISIASALLLASAFVVPSFAAPGDTGGGPTMGTTKSNDAGSGPTQGATGTNRPATAPNAATSGSMNQQGASAQGLPGGSMRIAQKMRDDLSKAGFTDIHIMPSSFLVRAKDSSGNTVMMVVNPDSITAITQSSARASHHGGGAANAAGATPGPKSTGGSQPVTPGGEQTKP